MMVPWISRLSMLLTSFQAFHRNLTLWIHKNGKDLPQKKPAQEQNMAMVVTYDCLGYLMTVSSVPTCHSFEKGKTTAPSLCFIGVLYIVCFRKLRGNCIHMTFVGTFFSVAIVDYLTSRMSETSVFQRLNTKHHKTSQNHYKQHCWPSQPQHDLSWLWML